VVSDLALSAALMIPIGGTFGSLFWIMIFLQTYRHFPKIDNRERFLMSAKSATILTGILLAVTYVSLLLLMRMILQ